MAPGLQCAERMKLGLLFAAALASIGCSSAPPNDQSDAAAEASLPDVVIEASAPQCADPPASKCTPQNQGSVIRGVLSFDPTHFSAGENVNLAIYLYHQWTMASYESTVGGHPHAYKYVKGVDVTTGQLQFDIDLCELGVAMYSEENCGFNLVVMLDETGKNDPDMYGVPAMYPVAGELVKLTPLTVSCHTTSQCVAITADCADGTSCTTYTPIAMSSCICATNSCPSQSTICTHADAGVSDAASD
jgi:hypothetical protein